MNHRRLKNRRPVYRRKPMAGSGWDINMLTNNLPGGIMSCDASPALNLLQYSDGFLNMFGYTREEIDTRFHNHFAEMIWPEDLEATWEDVRAQLAKGNTKQIEYRVLHKKGHLVSVLDRGQLVGGAMFCCILIDVTETRQALEALRMSLERYQIIMDQTTDIIFEWDISGDTLRYTQNWIKKFGYTPISTQVSSRLFTPESHLCREDMPKIREAMRQIAEAGQYKEVEFRIMRKEGQGLWCRARVTPQQDNSGKTTKAIGVIVDIDADRRTVEQLLARAERDSLTGLYNKVTAQSLAERYIAKAGAANPCAYMIIDVDNFKYVNDTYGHLGGDVILSDIGAMLQKMFREHDVPGRIGGDEFSVLMRDVTDPRAIQKRADEILRAFSQLAEDGLCKLSCSIGISIAPVDGMDFQTIYQKADAALYYAKTKGKNQFALYQSALPALGFTEEREAYATSVGLKIDSERESASIRARLAEYVFQVLYQSEDIISAIPSILEIVGRQFDVSRVYVFEDSADGAYAYNTYEWCNGCESQKDNLQQISYAQDLGDYYALFDENGVFYCRNVSELPTNIRNILEAQGIKSLLQCAIRDNGRNRGFVGFDECRKNRFWTQEQVGALSMIAEIISIFLLKSRAQSHKEEMLQNLSAILDQQESWIYAIDAQNGSLLYANEKMRAVLPDFATGEQCHRLFFGKDAPHGLYPLAQMDGRTPFVTKSFSEVLRCEVQVRVSRIAWADGNAAYLYTCSAG